MSKQKETYGYCVYHEIECDTQNQCIECPHNTEEDTEWFKQDEKQTGRTYGKDGK